MAGKTVIGLYDRFEDAQNVVSELVERGFPREDISLVAADTEGKFKDYSETESGEGMAAGAGIGAAVGGLGGLLVGLGALAIPGIGPVLAAGPLITTLAGAGMGAVAGGLIGSLVEMGVPEEQANLYAEGIRRGGTLVTIATDDTRANEAVEILNRHNPIDVNQRADSWRSSDQWNRFDETAQPYGTSDFERERQRNMQMDREGDTLDVVEEELQVGKREVETDRLRAHTYITERPVEENVDLRKESIDVERRKVDRPASDADLSGMQDETVEFTATSEEPVVQKSARVVEEVDIHKNVGTERHTIHDKLRRKDVDIEHLDQDLQSAYQEYDPIFRNHYQTSYSQMGGDYSQFRPAYFYGYDLAQDPQHRNLSWDQVEMNARRDWESRYQDRPWDEVREAIHQGWMAVTGR